MHLALLLLLLHAATPTVRQGPPGDTIRIFMLQPGYRLALRDSVYLCRTTGQLRTFLRQHARVITHASIETAPEETVDSVMDLMELLHRRHIRVVVTTRG
ncbi:MAG TPA: hypothetical protein VL547_06105 [Dinghuibacter sp.]|jgi:hypothetical protein|uniref:hypothetical protein n=1 Tax=Dinghuibacter sp. TaxID=2024697 RepID=UPI002B937541|nr:hypothetical protein [Dinghuibacter sp.]HTJ11574.1 hypothetical protein [Dinghuibacter sp.]